MPLRIIRATYKYFFKTIRVDPITLKKIHPLKSLEKIGTDYGGWVIPLKLINEDSICYSAGIGEDISFDVGLIDRFGCNVFAFDPTPRSKAYIERNFYNLQNFHYAPIGLWDKDEQKKFYEPADPSHVSHSILNLQKTENYFEAPCRRLSSIMKQLGHDKLDILKIDIEGAEYNVLKSIVEDKQDIKVLCIEYDESSFPMDKLYKYRIKRSLKMLFAFGYEIVAVDGKCNYTLIRRD
jgi:FkbM family methyltransferase